MQQTPGTHRIIGRIVGMALALAAAASATADPDVTEQTVAAGQALPSLQLTDQHERAHDISAGARLLLFAPDRDSSEIAHEVLEPLGGDAMAQAGIRYVADISAMPGIVTRMFALPRIREYSYPVMLARESADTAMLPARAGAVTVLDLAAGTVSGVRFADTADALRAMLDAAAAP
jgi:hypothetical protein